MSDPVHFYSPLRSSDALLPRSGAINWAERRHHHAISARREQNRLGVVIFWTIIAALLLARVMLADATAPQTDSARSVSVSQSNALTSTGM